jgi:hypothetical protein
MPILFVHGFHRLSNFLNGQKVTKKPPKPTDFGLPFIHPGFLNVAAIHGNLTRNYIRLPMATAILHPCKEAVPASILKGRSSCECKLLGPI